MRITIERQLPPETIDAFVPIYYESFAHLEELSASKQVMNEGEFRSLMASEDVLKFSGWTEDASLCAVALATPRLDLVPWVSPPFFAKRFPEQYGRDAIFFFLTILVREQDRDEPWATAIIEAIGLHCGAVQGVIVFDCCTFNNDIVKIPEIIVETGRRYVDFDATEVDVQHYHAIEVHGIREIDLRNVRHRAVIDLTDRRGPAADDGDTHRIGTRP